MTMSAADREKFTPEELEAMEELEQEDAAYNEDDDDEVETGEADDDAGDDDSGAEESYSREHAEEGEGEGANQDDEGAGDQGAIEDKLVEPDPIYTAEMPEDYEQKVADIDKRRAELDEQFDDGEIDQTEWRKAVRDLDREEEGLKTQAIKAQMAQEMHEQAQRKAWVDTVNGFLDDNPGYRAHQLRYNALNQTVIAIANDPANGNLSGRQILERAHREVHEAFGLPLEAPAQQGKQGKGKGKPQIPPTLGHLPAAETGDFENSRFAHLDRLLERSPEKYEAALAKLSEADYDAYLATQ